jgi:hypothetical protein
MAAAAVVIAVTEYCWLQQKSLVQFVDATYDWAGICLVICSFESAKSLYESKKIAE